MLLEVEMKTWSVYVDTPHDGVLSYDIYKDISPEKVKAELAAANRHFPPGVDFIAVIDDQTNEIILLGNYDKEEAQEMIDGSLS